VLPVQASSVPCERLFSACKHVATYQRSRLGSEKFEKIQVMKSTWQRKIEDLIAQNDNQVEEIDMDAYQEMLDTDSWAAELF
jgi:hypothetical protein